jgi:hypothetical protein
MYDELLLENEKITSKLAIMDENDRKRESELANEKKLMEERILELEELKNANKAQVLE